MVQEHLMGKVLNKYLHPAHVYDFEVPHLHTAAHAFVTTALVLNVLTLNKQQKSSWQIFTWLPEHAQLSITDKLRGSGADHSEEFCPEVEKMVLFFVSFDIINIWCLLLIMPDLKHCPIQL